MINRFMLNSDALESSGTQSKQVVAVLASDSLSRTNSATANERNETPHGMHDRDGTPPHHVPGSNSNIGVSDVQGRFCGGVSPWANPIRP
jgi:hypothetical protein